MEELLLSWRLAQTIAEDALELFHTQSWPRQSDTECCLCIIFCLCLCIFICHCI